MKHIANLLYSIVFTAFLYGSVAAQAVNPGDIVITEIMADPDAISDSDGEYIELFNRRSFDIYLDGYGINDGESVKEIDSLIIPANDFVTIAKSESPGFIPDKVVNISFKNSGDEVILTAPDGTIITSSIYTEDQVESGVALILNSLQNVHSDGVVEASNYIVATQEMSNGDIGSPGEAGGTDLAEVPTVQFYQINKTATEDAGVVEIDLVIEDPDGSTVSADVQFQSEISTAEKEDLIWSGVHTISFDATATDGEILRLSIPLNNDSNYEGKENAVFSLSNVITSGSAVSGNQIQTQLIIEDDDFARVVINEILPDPDDFDVDGNGIINGTYDDEFIELFNLEEQYINVSGWTLSDEIGIKFTFKDGAVIPPSSAVVVFSKDDADPNGNFGGSIVHSSDKTLSLNNSGDTVFLKDYSGKIIDSLEYTSTDDGISIVRSPDGTGSFINHDEAIGAKGNFSPGLRSDSTMFTTAIVIDGNSGWRMLSSPVENLAVSEIMDDTPIQGFGDGFSKNFYTGYNGSSFTFPENLDGTLESGHGFILYFFNNEKAGSKTLPVSIDVGNQSEPVESVTVPLHTNGNKWNLLGNPFQSAFHMDSLVVMGGDSGLASTVGHIWSNEYNSYILTTANNNRVAAGQGFFIENNDATAVTFPLSGKTSGTRFYKKRENDPAFVQLALVSTSEGSLREQLDISTMLYFHNNAVAGKDKWDSGKIYPLKNSYALLGITNQEGDEIKAQDSRSFATDTEVFFLDVEAKNVKPYQTLKWYKSENIPEYWNFTFVDILNEIELPMGTGFQYHFNHKLISHHKQNNFLLDDASKVVSSSNFKDPRFKIVLTKEKSVPVEPEHPRSLKLNQNYPNPFNPSTVISYQLPVSNNVRLEIFDMVGRKVATLVDEVKNAGTHKIIFKAHNLASGMYIYRLDVGNKVMTKKMALIK